MHFLDLSSSRDLSLFLPYFPDAMFWSQRIADDRKGKKVRRESGKSRCSKPCAKGKKRQVSLFGVRVWVKERERHPPSAAMTSRYSTISLRLNQKTKKERRMIRFIVMCSILLTEWRSGQNNVPPFFVASAAFFPLFSSSLLCGLFRKNKRRGAVYHSFVFPSALFC